MRMVLLGLGKIVRGPNNLFKLVTNRSDIPSIQGKAVWTIFGADLSGEFFRRIYQEERAAAPESVLSRILG